MAPTNKKTPGSTSKGAKPAATPVTPIERRRGRARKSDDDISRSLVQLGLTLSEARVYVSLLKAPGLTPAEAAADAGVARPRVYEALRLLEERGFATSVLDGNVTRSRALPPKFALDEWLRRRDQDRKLASEQDADLVADLVSRLPEPTPVELDGGFFSYMEGVYGRGRISDMLRSMVDGAETRIFNMTQPPWIQPRARWNVAEISALRRGVEVRMLVTPSGLADHQRWEPLAQAGGKVRVAETIPMKLIVCDRKEAMTSLRDPTTGEQGLSNVVIRHPDIVHSLELLFDDEWERAEPVELPKSSTD
jgi:sugar-specific transcriptional regulator TrmB